MDIIEDNIGYDIKKKYICENIVKLTNHKNYLDIVEFHEIQHTNNSNGIFINLNTISVDVIDKLYYKLKNEIEDDAFNITIIEKQIIEEEIEELFKKNNKKHTKKVYDIIKMEDFTEEECNIISLSKKYKI